MALLAIALTAVPAVADAQTTRAEVLEQQRAAKARELAPYEPGRLETFVARAEEGKFRRLITPHNGFFAQYGFSRKTPGAGIGFGGGFRHDLFARRARVELETGITFRNYKLLRADFSLPRLVDGHLELGVEAEYRHRPQEDFYGPGRTSLEVDRVNFLHKSRTVEGRAVVSPESWLRFGGRAGRLSPTVGPGTDSRFPSIEATFTDDSAPGLLQQPSYDYGEGFVEVDYRDEAGHPRAGGFYSAAWRTYADRDLDRYSFRAVDLLLQQFVPIFDKKRVFAFQAGLASTSASDGHDVPFYMQPTLGGSRTVRSVAEYRFRDRHALWLNAEYRWEVFGPLDMALFADAGKVAPEFGALDLSNLETGYGIGFRAHTASNVIFRLDIGTGAGEGIQYFFKFSKAF